MWRAFGAERDRGVPVEKFVPVIVTVFPPPVGPALGSRR